MTKKCGDLGGQLVHAFPEKCEAFAQITVDDSTSNLCQQVRAATSASVVVCTSDGSTPD